ncbi:MAG: ABC transporter permease [Oscillospiraceae bacterium]|jgi:putative ABC transport system permease protein|nr:ABC transporter permease [Oscillospiraceae bacterium]
MFFKQVRLNAARNRKGNGLFFGSLVISIIAFYTLLSLDKQDVMRFLGSIESDAVRKLMTLIPLVYVVSLFFVFFLVYFACKYQTDSRRREFGMYLMLGMKRGRLFFMLFCETLWSGLVSLLIGLPVALFLTEGISLVTAKLIGFGIIGHTISFSADAILWAVCGFVIVQLLSMLIICIPIGNAEPAKLLNSAASEKQALTSARKSTAFFIFGILLLLTAYYFGLSEPSGTNMSTYYLSILALLVAGVLGTFLLYRGLGSLIGKLISRKSQKVAGLATFTGRQVQENVLYQHKSLAVSSLLLLIALSCISYGIAVGIGRTTGSRTTDFSVIGTETDVATALKLPEIEEMVETSYPVHLSRTKTKFDTGNMIGALKKILKADNIVQNFHTEYVLSETSYNRLMSAMGKEPIDLSGNKSALYSTMGSNLGDFYNLLNKALKSSVTVGVNGETYSLLPKLYYDNIVADRSITLYTALIVPDELYQKLAKDTEPFCWNIHLKKSLTDKLGLMQATQKMGGYLAKAGFKYDSYLGSIGRNLFYTVATSYLTIYLGILFLLISNTVVGLKYLIQQRRNKHRYITLLMLGADTEDLCRSAKKQIQMFFTLVLSVAVCNSIIAIFTMFTNLTRLPPAVTSMTTTLAAIALSAFVITEIIYISIVKRTACREIRMLEVTDRG